MSSCLTKHNDIIIIIIVLASTVNLSMIIDTLCYSFIRNIWGCYNNSYKAIILFRWYERAVSCFQRPSHKQLCSNLFGTGRHCHVFGAPKNNSGWGIMPSCPPNRGHRDIKNNSSQSMHSTYRKLWSSRSAILNSNLIFIQGVGLILITHWFFMYQ